MALSSLQGSKGDDTEPARQRYECHDCDKRFDDLTDTIFAGNHQPLKVWVLCLYFMGLNLSNEQIVHELSINESDVYQMTTPLRDGIVKKKPTVTLSNEVECDEAYVIADHKGQPEVVKNKTRVILFGERSLRHVLSEYVEHYHRERCHQGPGNVIPFPSSRPANDREGPIECRERLGGLLKYYHRKAA